MNELVEIQERQRNQEPLATARWADPAYIADTYGYRDGALWLGRNPHNPDQAVGVDDDRHAFLGAETRSGKGTSVLVNNQVLWPGSMISIGPKGEEASIAALRRGQGNEQCEGMGQDVYVLDPMRCADVPEELRAHFNLLSGLEPDDGELVAKCDQRANAICHIPSAAGESAEWAKKGKEWVSVVMQHVVTFKYLNDDDRNILQVRKYVMNGNLEGANRIYAAMREKAEEEGEDPSEIKRPHPYRVLLMDMINNPACFEHISESAQDLLQSFETNGKLYDSVRSSASDHMKWLTGEGIRNTVVRPAKEVGNQVTFDPADLKRKKISLFIHLPEHNYDPLDRWLRAMIVILFQALQKDLGMPENGHRVLFIIDEFANLGKMDAVGKAINSIAGSGVKLMISTQRIGDLKEQYGEAWEKFIAAATQIWFGAEEMATREYLEKKLGKTEVVKYARSVGRNASQADAIGESESYTHTNSLSKSTTTGSSTGRTQGSSQSVSENSSRSRGSSSSWNKNRGRSANRNYGPGIFFHGWEHTLGDADSYGVTRGGGYSEQDSQSLGRSQGNSSSITHSENRAETEQRSTSQSHQRGTSRTQTTTKGESASIQESFHVKPLLSTSEIREHLGPVHDREHPAYPGMALVIVPGELPFFIRRSNYYEDPFFVGKFQPNPAYKFIPYEEMPLLGWQINGDYFFELTFPLDYCEGQLVDGIEPGDFVEKGQRFLRMKSNCEVLMPTMIHKAPIRLKILDVTEEDGRRFINMRGDQLMTVDDRIGWTDSMLRPWFVAREKHEKKEAERQAVIDALVREEEAETHKQWSIPTNKYFSDLVADYSVVGFGCFMGFLLLLGLSGVRGDAAIKPAIVSAVIAAVGVLVAAYRKDRELEPERKRRSEQRQIHMARRRELKREIEALRGSSD